MRGKAVVNMDILAESFSCCTLIEPYPVADFTTVAKINFVRDEVCHFGVVG